MASGHNRPKGGMRNMNVNLMQANILAPQDMMIVFLIVLILFGPKNLPKLASSMGRAIRDFKSGLAGVDQEIREQMEKSEVVETKAQVEHKAEVQTPESKPTVTTEKTD